jgi:hypothetical protein
MDSLEVTKWRGGAVPSYFRYGRRILRKLNR